MLERVWEGVMCSKVCEEKKKKIRTHKRSGSPELCINASIPALTVFVAASTVIIVPLYRLSVLLSAVKIAPSRICNTSENE